MIEDTANIVYLKKKKKIAGLTWVTGLALPAVFALAVEVVDQVAAHTTIMARVCAAVIDIFLKKKNPAKDSEKKKYKHLYIYWFAYECHLSIIVANYNLTIQFWEKKVSCCTSESIKTFLV